jgi:prevent-host-death family protein
MYTIGAFEAKTHFSALLDDVERGEQIIITKHGREVAKLSPIGSVNKLSVLEAIQSIKEFQRHHILGLDWKELRDEGRK